VRPPLRHRGEARKAGLTVFEFCIAIAAMVIARRSRASDAYRAGIREGRRAITARRNSEQPVYNTEIGSPDEQFAAVGSGGFERGRQRHVNDNADEDWFCETSNDELLRYAGLSRNGANNRRVAVALDRLTRAVRNNHPVLVEWKQVSETRIELGVAREWLSLQRYGRVLLPLPTSSRDALALHLFLTSISLSRRNRISIPADTLYGRLGIRTGRPAHDERALRKALYRVNELRIRNELPSTIVLLEDGKGRWRFVEHANSDEEIDVEEIKDAIALRQNDGLGWNDVAKLVGRTPHEIREAVQLYWKNAERDASLVDDAPADDEEYSSLDEDYSSFDKAAFDREFRRLKAEERAGDEVWPKASIDD
jgi:hypothetical protein